MFQIIFFCSDDWMTIGVFTLAPHSHEKTIKINFIGFVINYIECYAIDRTVVCRFNVLDNNLTTFNWRHQISLRKENVSECIASRDKWFAFTLMKQHRNAKNRKWRKTIKLGNLHKIFNWTTFCAKINLFSQRDGLINWIKLVGFVKRNTKFVIRNV